MTTPISDIQTILTSVTQQRVTERVTTNADSLVVMCSLKNNKQKSFLTQA